MTQFVTTIDKQYPELYKQLMMYYISPSFQVLEDLKSHFKVESIDEIKDYRFDHALLMELRRNQLTRGLVKRTLHEAKVARIHTYDKPCFPEWMMKL